MTDKDAEVALSKKEWKWTEPSEWEGVTYKRATGLRQM